MGPESTERGDWLGQVQSIQEVGTAYREVWQQMERDSLETQTLEPDFWVWVLALELTSCTILDELFNLLSLSFLACKTIIVIIITL